MEKDHSVVASLLEHSDLDLGKCIQSLHTRTLSLLHSGYRHDDITTYCHNITLLHELVSTQCRSGDGKEYDENSIASSMIDLCVEFLGNIHPSADSRKEVLILLGCICSLVTTCSLQDKDTFLNILKLVESKLDVFLVEKPTCLDVRGSDSLSWDMHTTMEVLRCILMKVKPGDTTLVDDQVKCTLYAVYSKVIEALENIPAEIIGSIIVPVLIRILMLDNDRVADYLHKIWTCVSNCFSAQSEVRTRYVLLCGLANYLFPVSGVALGIDVRTDDKLWDILQAGLLSKDSVNRKRSLYLVKRMVDVCANTKVDVNVGGASTKVDVDVGGASTPRFWWCQARAKEFSKVWEDFMLLAEVLEEKQIHVIKPLLPRMKCLIKATEVNKNGECPVLHTSWLTTMFLRSCHHESLQIIRWAAGTMLSLDLNLCPMFQQGQDKFLSGPMLYALQEPKLYVRDPENPVGSMPVLAEKLAHFFLSCWKTLPQERRDLFFCATIQNICNVDWSPIALLFVCRGLATLPECPCIDRDAVQSLRTLFTGSLATMESYVRGAVQGFLVQTLSRLTDKSKVPLDDFTQILAMVRQEDSLQRGTTLWSQCVTWLGQVEEGTDWSAENIVQYLDTSTEKLLETTLDSKYNAADKASALVIARLLLLAADASIATQVPEDGASLLGRVMNRLVVILTSINSHAYMSSHKADKALQMMCLLVKEMVPKACKPDDPVAKVILAAVKDSQSEILVYICRQMSEAIVSLLDLPLMELYMEGVDMLMSVAKVMPELVLTGVVNHSIPVLNRHADQQESTLPVKMQQLISMWMLGKVAHFLSHDLPAGAGSEVTRMKEKMYSFMKTWKIQVHFTKPSTDVSVSQQEWGKVTSIYLQHQWEIIGMSLQQSAVPWCDVKELLALALETLSVGLEETSIPVMQALKVIIAKAVSAGSVSDTVIVEALDACWSSWSEARRAALYWTVLEVLVQVAFQPCLIAQGEESAILACLKKYAWDLVEIGEERSGVANILMRHLYTVGTSPGMLDHLHKFTPLIVRLCVFGGIPRRGDRQMFDITAAMEAQGNQCPINEIRQGMTNQDLLIRAMLVNLLCHLNPAHTAHRTLGTEIIRQCIDAYRELAKISTNAFANSLVHRQRHRLIQMVVLLESFVTEEYLPELWKFVWQTLEQEAQPSVRHMLEWLAMWAMHRHTHLAQQLWVLFDKYRETKNMVLCSLLCIVIHMGPHLPPQQQEDYYQHAIPSILPWCMAHHFNTRIFAQATLVKLWTQCTELQLNNILKAHAVLQFIVEFNQENRNSTKNVKKLLDSFFFKFLDFRRDYSLESLYHLLPTMTALSEEDWIRPELFVQTNPDWAHGKGSCFIPLRNNSKKLRDCEPGMWKYKGALRVYGDEEGEETAMGEGDGDVQKKIMPWKQMFPDEGTSEEIEHGVKQHNEDGLTVVTSLINKVPNLGGLCRTSEIFGVSEYVLGKLLYVEDRVFQSLSVTAQKWVPITEVHESKLPEYLQQKRQAGYTLVGVEQTANSVSLTDYTFPRKTLLLLGNEKEGIPVELISLLDVCVEIPQQGVVRSLNVHVSGALLIWEYRRQQLMAAST